ncbi:MAG: DegT/DnrJ/EryC1/StrS family aminotransferase, partial [Pirellulales bacterium]
TAGSFQDAPTVPMGLPVCTEVANEIVSLPMFPEMTREQVQRVCVAVEQVIQQEELV